MASVVSSPVRSTTGSPGFRSQRKLSAGTIIKKIQTLQDTIESLRQQLVFTRAEEESVPPKEVKKAKQIKEKMPAAATKQKKIQETKEEEKDKIPMPWTGQADFATCVGLKAQYGLFIQCGKACDMKNASFQIDNHECRFCNDCSKKCDENGKHSVGTIEERIEAGVGKYVNAKTGKKETMYIDALEKMKITKEEALEAAARRGFQIPDWMLEKAEKKRGRPAASGATVAKKVEAEVEIKEKKPRQPRAKTTTAAKKTAATKAIIETNDTPQKTNSVQSSVCIDLNQDDDVTPVAADVAAATTSTPIPQENEKKKRGRPSKSNTQNNVGESEMQRLILQATTEKKKRLSLDPSDICPSSQEESGQIETCLTFETEGEGKENDQEDEDEIFEMFHKIVEEEERNQQQQQVVVAATVEQVEPVIVATNEKKEKKEKSTKKTTKKSDEENIEKTDKKKVDKKEAAAAKKKAEEEAAAAKKKAEEEAAAAKKKAEEEAAAAKKKAEEEDDETEDEEEEQDEYEDEEELECEEYEYEGETYGLAPNGDIYSQDGDLVGKLTNGVPQMFN
jgi:hypothetical protein